MDRPEFIDISTPGGEPFQALFWKGHQSDSCRNEAVVFFHAVGENKSGLNYLFQEMAEEAHKAGFDSYRFDLSGSGESLGALSLLAWINQLQALSPHLSAYHKVHAVARGTGSILLSHYPFNGEMIAVGPPIKRIFEENLANLRFDKLSDTLVTPLQQGQSIEEENFWYNLGAEAGCIGGLMLPLAFLDQVHQSLDPIPSHWHTYYSDRVAAALELTNAVIVKGAHPLFWFASDRAFLKNELIRIIT